MASKGRDYRLNYSWTDPKGLLTMGLFTAAAVVSEFFIVSFFAGSGLTDVYAASLPVSPLFHILPIVVIAVLVISWMYVTKHALMTPRVTAPAKKSRIHRRRPRKTSQKSSQNIVGAIKKGFSKIAAMVSGSSESSVQKRLTFSRAALESTVTVLTLFLLTIIILSVLVYPRLFTDFAAQFYSTTSPLQGLMQSIANALVPVASALNSIAPALRSLFGGLASSSAQSLSNSDILLRYAVCQSVAAGLSAVSAYIYAKYAST